MVAFRFSAHGFEYRSGIRVIKKTYSISRQALHDEKYAVYAKLEAIRRGELEDDYDPEDGMPSLSDELEYELMGIEDSRQSLAQAVLLILYHFWEKQVVSWAGKMSGKDLHKNYIGYCTANGLAVHEQRLDELRCLANLVKHGQGNSDWGERLHALNADLFRKNAGTMNSLECLSLSDDYVIESFDAVLASGPDINSAFNPISTS